MTDIYVKEGVKLEGVVESLVEIISAETQKVSIMSGVERWSREKVFIGENVP